MSTTMYFCRYTNILTYMYVYIYMYVVCVFKRLLVIKINYINVTCFLNLEPTLAINVGKIIP